MNKQAKIQLATASARRSTTLSALLRIVGAFGMALALTQAAQILAAAISAHKTAGQENLIAIDTTLTLTLIALGCALVIIGTAGEILVSSSAARREENLLRRRILAARYRAHQQDFRDGAGPAHVVSLLTDNAERYTEFRLAYLGGTIGALLIPVLTLLYVSLAIDPVIGLTLLVLYPVVPLLVGGFMSIFRKRSAASQWQRAILSSKYLDAIRNLITIRLLNAGERVEENLREEGERNRGAIMRLLAGNQLVIIILDGAVSLLWISLAAILSALRYGSGAIDLAGALSVVFLTVLLIEPIAQVAGFFYVGMGGIASGKAIKKYLSAAETDTPMTAAEFTGRSGCDAVSSDTATSDIAAVEISGLDFNYPGQQVLRGIELRVPAGARIALTGPSGSGKSTLLALLAGDLTAAELAINIAGRPLCELGTAGTRAQSAVVAQKTWIFGGTIADNLRIAAPNADDTQLWEALERANLAGEVRTMPGGLDSDVGERGAFLSGGQAQRLSLARAWLSGRKLWLLDEPTAQVDGTSERLLGEAIAGLPRDITIIFSTHRDALLALADQTFRLADGGLTEVKHD